MSNVTRLRHALPLGQDINKALVDLDSAIAKAIDASKNSGLLQGIVVAVLQVMLMLKPRRRAAADVPIAV